MSPFITHALPVLDRAIWASQQVQSGHRASQSHMEEDVPFRLGHDHHADQATTRTPGKSHMENRISICHDMLNYIEVYQHHHGCHRLP